MSSVQPPLPGQAGYVSSGAGWSTMRALSASIIGTMHDADMDAWRAIDHGERPIDWVAFIGHPDGADYLTQAGKDLMT
jgi:hypothetical protein